MKLIPLARENADHRQKTQKLFLAAPTYFRNTAGALAPASAAAETFAALPEGIGFERKFVFGVEEKQELIGCIDLIRGFPQAETLMLGLLLLAENAQGKGFGRAAYALVEKQARAWPEIQKVRIGVVRANEQVLGFWLRLGFQDTGVRRPYSHGTVESETLVLEKSLA